MVSGGIVSQKLILFYQILNWLGNWLKGFAGQLQGDYTSITCVMLLKKQYRDDDTHLVKSLSYHFFTFV